MSWSKLTGGKGCLLALWPTLGEIGEGEKRMDGWIDEWMDGWMEADTGVVCKLTSAIYSSTDNCRGQYDLIMIQIVLLIELRGRPFSIQAGQTLV